MRISTYNIWDNERGMPDRFFHIIEEIKKNKADILCLQELPNYEMFNSINENCGYTVGYLHSEYGIGICTNYDATNVF